jgi:prevent-host-death family protein
MEVIGSFEAKTHFSALLMRVEKGEEITISRRGKPVARLIPEPQVSELTPAELVAMIKKSRKKNRLDGISWQALRDEGRK